MFTAPFPRNRSLLLQRGPHRKHFDRTVDCVCVFECLQSCCLVMRWSNLLQYCHASGVPWQIIMGSGSDDWNYCTAITITLTTATNYNSSQLVTAFGSFHFLLEYKRLPFHCGWPINSYSWPIHSFTIWFTHSLSLSLIHSASWSRLASFYNIQQTVQKSPPWRVQLLLFMYALCWKCVYFPGNQTHCPAMDVYSWERNAQEFV
jgi:hypothetical protein